MAFGTAAGAALGTSPPTPVMTTASNDERAIIKFGSGATPTTGTALTFTLAGNYSSTLDGEGFVTPFLAPLNAATAALGLYIVSVTGQSIVLGVTTAPAASQAVGTYQVAVKVELF